MKPDGNDTGWLEHTHIAYDDKGKPYPAKMRWVRVKGAEGVCAVHIDKSDAEREAEFQAFLKKLGED